jgi:ectoine hydroxylase
MIAKVRDPYESRVGGGSELARREDPVVWPGRSGPLDDTQLRQYEAGGFIVMRDLLGAEATHALLVEAERLASIADKTRDDVILEPDGDAVRSLFRVHRSNKMYEQLTADPRLADIARQILGEDVYTHQSRINFKPAFEGEPFSWHSDFETWHVEDGMPRMRALSASVLLTENTEHNGPLLVIPGSHKSYVRCTGVTPPEHFKVSLRQQEYGVPARSAIAELAQAGGVASVTGPPGTVVFFDSNLLHASSGNVTPLARHNVFLVYNAVSNGLVAPFGGRPPRPNFLAEREVVAIRRAS